MLLERHAQVQMLQVVQMQTVLVQPCHHSVQASIDELQTLIQD